MRGATFLTCSLLALTAVVATPASGADRRAQIEKVRDGLNDPDPLVRLITLEEVAASEDATLRSIAIRQAVGIADPDLQALAARMFVSNLSVLALDLSGAKVTSESSDKEKAKGKRLLEYLSQKSVNFILEGFNPANGAFQARFQEASLSPRDGQVTGLSVSFQASTGYAVCNVTLHLGEALDLAGDISCMDDGIYVTAAAQRKFY